MVCAFAEADERSESFFQRREKNVRAVKKGREGGGRKFEGERN